MKENLVKLIKEQSEKNYLWIALIILLPVLLLSRTLFWGEVIRASDIVSQYMWGVTGGHSYPGPFSGSQWAPNVNFGTDISIGAALSMLPYRFLVYG